jgi:hypothetical protein
MAGPDDPEPMSFAMEGNERNRSIDGTAARPAERRTMDGGPDPPEPSTIRQGWQQFRNRSRRHCRTAAPRHE